MTAVAVWDHRPTDDELLAARLERGWSPAATPTADGDVVLGHAACLVMSSHVESDWRRIAAADAEGAPGERG